ncbi:ComEA family DNA-binding protein [Terribacillus saccharophilus]|uniref:helix-hairpin-helix domain-containing protein n=1 Tax=Terribacillus saccharophilus TaxID=361277 RepID=UPI00398225ED
MHLLKRYSWLIILLGMVCVFLFSWMKDTKKDAAVQPLHETPEGAAAPLLEEAAPSQVEPAAVGSEQVVVDIKGEVRNPGVYELAPDSRVEGAIKAAGGVTENAEGRSINLAQRVADEQVIYVAAVGEAEVSIPAASSANEAADKININQADAQELTELNGVGEAKAQAIITYREESGPFTSVDQLMEVPGIGEKSLENMKEQIGL